MVEGDRYIMFLFDSYTMRFDKVKLDYIVENVNDLPHPEVSFGLDKVFTALLVI